jgi:hypothetical protein
VLEIYEGANEIQALAIAGRMLEQAHAREAIWPEAMPDAEGT